MADSAHSFGASYKGKRSGAVADFTTFSFHAVKNITTGEGGAVTWKSIPGLEDDDIYEEFQRFSLHGQTKDALAKIRPGEWEYDIIAPYYKCNMTDVIASIGIGQLKRYDEILNRRKEIMKMYTEGFDISKVEVIDHFRDDRTSCMHLCLVRFKGRDREYCNDLIDKMAKLSIPLNVHYKPLPLLTAYRNLGFDPKDYPNAMAMYENEVTLPLHPHLTDEQVRYIIDNINSYLEEND